LETASPGWLTLDGPKTAGHKKQANHRAEPHGGHNFSRRYHSRSPAPGNRECRIFGGIDGVSPPSYTAARIRRRTIGAPHERTGASDARAAGSSGD
jgi:hypothetical protein